MTKTKTLKQKKAESKYRVLQGATPTGKELMSRLRNKSLIPGEHGEGSYTMDDDIVKASRMHKKDIINKSRENKAAIEKYEQHLEEGQGKVLKYKKDLDTETSSKNETNKKTITKPQDDAK